MTLYHMSIYGAVLILAILLIRALTLHKLPKRIFLILWSIALLRLLVPFEITSDYSIYTLLPTKNTAELTLIQPEYSVPAETTAATPVLPLLWFTGTVLLALYFGVSYFRCYREFNTSLPLNDTYLLHWLEAHPLKRTISIRQSDRIATPLTYGIFRPVILLPKNTDRADRKQLDYILFHEFTHIRRLDQVAKLCMIAALCLHWFNPLAWVMYHLFNRDIELSCDECVLQDSMEERSGYAMTLIHMEEKRSNAMPLCSHFSENSIEERIKAIMKMQKLTFGAVFLGLLLVLTVALTLTTTAKAAEPDPTAFYPPQPSVTFTPTPTPDPGPTVTPTPKLFPAHDPGPTVTPPPEVAALLNLERGE